MTLRRAVLHKGAEINEQLSRLLAGQKVDISALLGPGQPGEREEERLRRFLDTINAALRAMQEGHYGRCHSCGGLIPYPELEQIPWADTCLRCATQTDG